ncbi:MAG: SGNH/GDSL hydrolase family protein [Planctomycetota bacterium]|nr:SGNH/GDSL hydrolase family protein [Planctomycetota bacterium]
MPTKPPLPIFVLRRGLPRVAAKLAAGRPVAVAYFGGSITQADGYRVGTTAWLRERFPKSKITEISAGIGGTGSDLGTFRLENDVLRHKPDLMFVEFAVNDAGEGHDVRAAIEGIVRRTMRDVPGCDIAFVYTLSKQQLGPLGSQTLPAASRLHEPVAEHYGLPSINVALDAARQLERGELKWEDFAGDACHPTPRGHGLYTKTMAAALAEAFAAPAVPKARGAKAPAKTRLPKPLTSAPWQEGRMITIDPKRHRFEGWSYRPLVNRGGWECFDGVLESDSVDPAHEVAVDFRGSAVGLYFSVGPDSGNVLWSVDDGPFTPARLVDKYAKMFVRPSYKMLIQGLKPGKHRLRLRVAPRREPGLKGRWVRIAHVLCR